MLGRRSVAIDSFSRPGRAGPLEAASQAARRAGERPARVNRLATQTGERCRQIDHYCTFVLARFGVLGHVDLSSDG